MFYTRVSALLLASACVCVCVHVCVCVCVCARTSITTALTLWAHPEQSISEGFSENHGKNLWGPLVSLILLGGQETSWPWSTLVRAMQDLHQLKGMIKFHILTLILATWATLD